MVEATGCSALRGAPDDRRDAIFSSLDGLSEDEIGAGVVRGFHPAGWARRLPRLLAACDGRLDLVMHETTEFRARRAARHPARPCGPGARHRSEDDHFDRAAGTLGPDADSVSRRFSRAWAASIRPVTSRRAPCEDPAGFAGRSITTDSRGSDFPRVVAAATSMCTSADHLTLRSGCCRRWTSFRWLYRVSSAPRRDPRPCGWLDGPSSGPEPTWIPRVSASCVVRRRSDHGGEVYGGLPLAGAIAGAVVFPSFVASL